MRRVALGLAILLSAGMAGAQDYLNCHSAPGWEPSGEKRSYAPDNLYDYKDGGAEGYLSFGFAHMQGITCKHEADTLDIDVSEMGDADLAYGMFAANADPSLPIEKIGMGGQVLKQSATFAKGKYYVELVVTAARTDSDQATVLKAFVSAMLAHLEGRETPPEALAWFAGEDLVSLRVVPESVLGLKQLKRGYVAKYKQGQAFLVQEATPAAAAEALKAVQARFEATAAAQVGEEGFQVKAKYLDGLCIFRKESFVAGYANLPEAADAVKAAAALAARIP